MGLRCCYPWGKCGLHLQLSAPAEPSPNQLLLGAFVLFVFNKIYLFWFDMHSHIQIRRDRERSSILWFTPCMAVTGLPHGYRSLSTGAIFYCFPRSISMETSQQRISQDLNPSPYRTRTIGGGEGLTGTNPKGHLWTYEYKVSLVDCLFHISFPLSHIRK